MKIIASVLIVLIGIFLVNQQNINISAQNCDTDSIPERLVIIRGKAIITNHPDLGEIPASGQTIIFQKVGCNSCYIGTKADGNGKYEMVVGDGKYKVIFRNPASPGFDMLIPEQERFIDTETLEAKKYSKRIFDFDVKIRIPKD